MIFVLKFFIIFSITSVFTAFAENDLTADLKSAQEIVNNLCIACHAADGNSALSVNPKLAGQHAAYITKQLMNFKSGKRDNAIMAGMVASLTKEDMTNLGIYFSKKNLTLATANANGPGSSGEKIFRAGIAKKGVPACASCHGPAGHGIPDVYPRLNAQHSEYTVSQLNLFRIDKRANDSSKSMRTIAKKLTEKEMQDVADYIQGLR